MVKEIIEIVDGLISAEITFASIQFSNYVIEVARGGSDIATIPYKIIESMIKHPMTENGIQRFLSDWATVEQK